MLTKDDIKTIRSLLDPLESRLGARISRIETQLGNRILGVETQLGNRILKVEKLLINHKKISEKEHRRLQGSINRLVDDLGEDVYVLKEKMQRVETHLGFAPM